MGSRSERKRWPRRARSHHAPSAHPIAKVHRTNAVVGANLRAEAAPVATQPASAAWIAA